jgi:hypothetical protein
LLAHGHRCRREHREGRRAGGSRRRALGHRCDWPCARHPRADRAAGRAWALAVSCLASTSGSRGLGNPRADQRVPASPPAGSYRQGGATAEVLSALSRSAQTPSELADLQRRLLAWHQFLRRTTPTISPTRRHPDQRVIVALLRACDALSLPQHGADLDQIGATPVAPTYIDKGLGHRSSGPDFPVDAAPRVSAAIKIAAQPVEADSPDHRPAPGAHYCRWNGGRRCCRRPRGDVDQTPSTGVRARRSR